jgi:starch-binding outer membrane protein, SusD/RagB family
MKTPIVIALAMVAAGCGSLTETSASQILASNLFAPSNASLLANSVVADFQCAYADYATATGLVSDELQDAGLFQIGWDYDRRTLTANSPIEDYACSAIGTNPGSEDVPGVWGPLSTALFDGDTLLTLLNTWTATQVPTRIQLIGQTAAYAGYTLTLMGETMCAGAINGGPRLTPDSLLGVAEAEFGVAITNATAAGDNATLDMALLGRARERLDRGQAANAAIDAAKIPSGFLAVATYDGTSSRRENRLYTVMWRDLLYSVQSPFQNFTTAGVPDPRVVVTQLFANGKAVTGEDGFTDMWSADKDPAIDTPIPIAHYTEAQLIIAEADNDAGNSGGAITIINTLRAAYGLPAYTGSASTDSVQAAIIHERAAELFLEGHRLADMIRYGQTYIPLNPPAGTPFSKGGTYGTQLCFPLPVVENGT